MKPGQTFDLTDKNIQSLEQDGSKIWDTLGQNVSGDEPEASPVPPPLSRPAPQSSHAPESGHSAKAGLKDQGQADNQDPGRARAQPSAGQPFIAPIPKGAASTAATSKAAPQAPSRPTTPRLSPAAPTNKADAASAHDQGQGNQGQRSQGLGNQNQGNGAQANNTRHSASQSALSHAAQRLNQQRSYRWLTVLVLALAALFVLLLLVDTLTGLAWLFGISRALGLLASLLLATALASLGILVGREWRALARMSRQRHLRQLTEAALFETGAPGANEAMLAVEASYAKQDETAWLVAQFRELAPQDAYSAVDRLEVFEREVLRKLDSQAVDLIEENARNTAIITTISPFALFDALFTLWRNLRMIRQVATVYGVAPGFWGSLRLLRQVFANVLLTGGLEAADGALNQLLGGSLTAKLSTKLSEGLVNGMLSARLGLAAMDQCRPLPFKHNRRPRLSDIGARLVGSVRKSIMKGKDQR